MESRSLSVGSNSSVYLETPKICSPACAMMPFSERVIASDCVVMCVCDERMCGSKGGVASYEDVVL